jgi:hypothetical protein
VFSPLLNLINALSTKNVVSRTGTFLAETNARERKNERSSSSIERDAVEKRRRDATRAMNRAISRV